MKRLQSFMQWVTLERRAPARVRLEVEKERESTERAMSTAVVFGMQVRDSRLGILDHSTRVAFVADRIALQLGVNEADRHILLLAARLHELGMFAVPQELLLRRTPLSTSELQRVRAQASTSAEVARMVHPPRVAELIENQYEDYRKLAGTRPIAERDLLLAGILRVADVFAAVTWPRPYQDPLAEDVREDLLRNGAGAQFHPAAVESVFKLPARL